MLTKQTEASEDENGKPIVKDNRINCLSAYVNGLYGEKETNWTTALKNKSVFSYKKWFWGMPNRTKPLTSYFSQFKLVIT